MTRVTIVLVCWLFVSPAIAQLVATQEDDGTFVYQMTVAPAEEPTPRLRYRLVTADDDLQPGNAATFWYRAMLDWERGEERARSRLAELLPAPAEPEKQSAKASARAAMRDWMDPLRTPLAELPIDEARLASTTRLGNWAQTELERAVHRCRCDWGLGARALRGPAAFTFVLPEFQGMRDLSRALCLHARVAIAEGRADDAIEILRWNTEMGIDAAEPPFLVCRLIGAAISRQGWGVLRDLQCHAEGPSLYWALADLPRPFVDGRESIRFESGTPFRLYDLIVDPESAERSDIEWRRLYDESLDSLAELAASRAKGNPPTHNAERAKELARWIEELRAVGLDHPSVRFARQRLIEQGSDAERLNAMPPAQILAIDAARVCRVLNDAIEAAVQLPWPEGRAAREKAIAKLESADPLGDAPHREVLPIAQLTAANTGAAMTGLMLRDREIALLRLVEALRLHAGTTGELPESLDEVACVPIPRNPATAEPFAYRLIDGKAIITTTPADGLTWCERYEIRLAK